MPRLVHVPDGIGHVRGGEQAHGCKSRRTSAGYFSEARQRHAADGEHRQWRRGDGFRQCRRSNRRLTGLGRSLEHSAEDQIVEPAGARGGHGAAHAVHRASEEKTVRRDGPHTHRRNGILAEMYAVRAGCERDIQTIVHDHARMGAADGVERAVHQVAERPRVELRLSNLDQVEAGAGGGGGVTRQTMGRTGDCSAPIFGSRRRSDD